MFEWRRLGWERLRRRCPFTRSRGLRHGTLLDRPYRLTRHAIENKGKALFGHLHNRFDRFATDSDIRQDWRGRQIVVPEIVMHELIVPDTFARFRLEAHKTVAEEIVAKPVASIHVARRRR